MQSMGKLAERLKFIEFLLMYCGSINRASLKKQFQIAAAGATRDLKSYKDEAPNNLAYNANQKSYLISKSFRPIFQHDPNDALLYFSSQNDLGNTSVKCVSANLLHSVRNEILSPLTTAMNQNKAIIFDYHSPKTGTKQRSFVPNCIVNDGIRWHVRGYCRLRNRFIDLVISRIQNVSIIESSINNEIESIETDRQWNRFVDLELAAHPDLDYPEAIEYEHQMVDGILKLEMRAAVVGYFLRSWGVDCSEDHSLDASTYQLWLRNTQALYGVGNAFMGAGYEKIE